MHNLQENNALGYFDHTISRRFIYKWAQRFLTAGVAGLADAPRPGAPHGRRTPMRIAHGRWEQIQERTSCA